MYEEYVYIKLICHFTEDIHCKNDNFFPKIAAEKTAVVNIFTYNEW